MTRIATSDCAFPPSELTVARPDIPIVSLSAGATERADVFFEHPQTASAQNAASTDHFFNSFIISTSARIRK